MRGIRVLARDGCPIQSRNSIYLVKSVGVFFVFFFPDSPVACRARTEAARDVRRIPSPLHSRFHLKSRDRYHGLHHPACRTRERYLHYEVSFRRRTRFGGLPGGMALSSRRETRSRLASRISTGGEREHWRCAPHYHRSRDVKPNVNVFGGYLDSITAICIHLCHLSILAYVVVVLVATTFRGAPDRERSVL